MGFKVEIKKRKCNKQELQAVITWQHNTLKDKESEERKRTYTEEDANTHPMCVSV